VHWIDIWTLVLQPFLFIGLFLINVIIVIITIKNEMRLIKENKQSILDNAKHITENYEKLCEILKDTKND